jgi:hypothetical protein
MVQFEVQIATGNDAFQDGNGNTVGRASWV